MNSKVFCVCCGRKCDAEKDGCTCGVTVCVSCVQKYDHYMQGKHEVPSKAKKRPRE